jgi:hypothetical protein
MATVLPSGISAPVVPSKRRKGFPEETIGPFPIRQEDDSYLQHRKDIQPTDRGSTGKKAAWIFSVLVKASFS